MAFVFGIKGVPIFEMSFVISLLQLIGLIFILLEMRRLGTLITKEKRDLKRFEKDLSTLEDDTGSKPSNKLADYVKSAIAKGMTPDQIEKSLMLKGWSKEEIDKTLVELGK